MLSSTTLILLLAPIKPSTHHPTEIAFHCDCQSMFAQKYLILLFSTPLARSAQHGGYGWSLFVFSINLSRLEMHAMTLNCSGLNY